MSKNNNYEAGYRDGRNNSMQSSSDRGYRQGYSRGKQEYDFWNDKELYPSLRYEDETKRDNQQYDPLAYQTSTPATMIGGSIGLTLVGWSFVGLLLFLFWIGGESGSWWFPWIWRIAFWGGIGFIIMISVIGIIMAVIEKFSNSKQDPKDNQNR